jgi:hypothetical protein
VNGQVSKSLRYAQRFNYSVAREKMQICEAFFARAQGKVQVGLANASIASKLMPEVAHPGEDHGKARFVGGGDHLVITNRTAGLDHCARPRFCR